MEPAPAFDDPRDIKGHGLMYSPTHQAARLDAPRCIKGYGLLYGGLRPLGAGFDRRRKRPQLVYILDTETQSHREYIYKLCVSASPCPKDSVR